MTKREPFAVVAIIDHVPVATFVEISGIYVGSYGGDDALQNANALADRLNAAFETAVAKRVKEAARKAVEEFKTLVVQTISAYPETVDNEWNRKSGFFDSVDIACDDLVEVIQKLTTEPEAK